MIRIFDLCSVDLIRGHQLVVADNVAEFLWAYSTKEERAEIGKSLTRSLLPPFEALTIGYKANFYEMDEICAQLITRQTDSGWRVEVSLLARAKNVLSNKPGVLSVLGVLHLDEMGNFVRAEIYESLAQMDARRRALPPACVVSDPSKIDYSDINVDRFFSWFAPAALAIQFMHCKNVTLVDVVAPPKLAKKRLKKSGVVLHTYKVLNLQPLKHILEKVGSLSTQGITKALHICRGHFADYGVDGKGLLFGKQVGTFWVPAHLRGNASAGTVDKTYNVSVPAAA